MITTSALDARMSLRNFLYRLFLFFLALLMSKYLVGLASFFITAFTRGPLVAGCSGSLPAATIRGLSFVMDHFPHFLEAVELGRNVANAKATFVVAHGEGVIML